MRNNVLLLSSCIGIKSSVRYYDISFERQLMRNVLPCGEVGLNKLIFSAPFLPEDVVYQGRVSENGGVVEVYPEIKAENGPICGFRIVNTDWGNIPFEVSLKYWFQEGTSAESIFCWLTCCRYSWQALRMGQLSSRPDILSTVRPRRVTSSLSLL